MDSKTGNTSTSPGFNLLNDEEGGTVDKLSLNIESGVKMMLEKSDLVESKQLLTMENCKKKCHLRIKPKDKEQIYQSYLLNTTIESRLKFVCDRINMVPRPEEKSGAILIKYLVTYHLDSEKGRENVCGACFRSILGENVEFINSVLTRKKNDLSGTIKLRNLGKPKVPEKKDLQVKQSKNCSEMKSVEQSQIPRGSQFSSTCRYKFTDKITEDGTLQKMTDEKEGEETEEVKIFTLLSSCGHNCKNRIPEDVQKQIFVSYNQNNDIESKYKFISDHTVLTKLHPQVGEPTNPLEPYRSFFFLNTNKSHQTVCEVCFQTVLNEDPRTIASLLDRKWGEMRSELRRKELEIEEHIKKFALLESHHITDQDTGKFLPFGLNVETMFNLYREEVSNPVSISSYQEVFERSGLKFASSYVGNCITCEIACQMKKLTSDPGEKRKYHSVLTDHMTASLSSELSLSRDLERCNQTCHLYSFGFQQSLPTPFPNIGDSYYKQQSWTYSFSVSKISNNNSELPEESKNYMWHESLGGKTVNEIAACLFQFLKDLPLGIKTLVLYSSSCNKESRSTVLSMLFFFILHHHKTLNSIQHKFLLDGHSHNKKTLENNSKIIQESNGKIKQPQDWYDAFINGTAESSVKTEIVIMSPDKFYDFKNLWEEIAEDESFIDEDVKCLRYVKHGTVFRRNDWKGEYEVMTMSSKVESLLRKCKNGEFGNLKEGARLMENEKDHFNFSPLMSPKASSSRKKQLTECDPAKEIAIVDPVGRRLRSLYKILGKDSGKVNIETHNGLEQSELPLETKMEYFIKLENGDFPKDTVDKERRDIENDEQGILEIENEKPLKTIEGPSDIKTEDSEIKTEDLIDNSIYESVTSTLEGNAINQFPDSHSPGEICFVKEEQNFERDEDQLQENLTIETVTLPKTLSSLEEEPDNKNPLLLSNNENTEIECSVSGINSPGDSVKMSRNVKTVDENWKHRCIKKCHLKIPEEDGIKISNNYWSKTAEVRFDYLFDSIHMQLNPQKVEKSENHGKTEFSVLFCLETEEGRQNVCEYCFRCFLGETDQVISTVLKSKSQAIIERLNFHKKNLESGTKQASLKCNSKKQTSSNKDASPQCDNDIFREKKLREGWTRLHPCRNGCYLRITASDQENIFKSYWQNATIESRISFIMARVNIVPKYNTEMKKSIMYRKYHHNSSKGHQRVCTLCFCLALGETINFVENVVKRNKPNRTSLSKGVNLDAKEGPSSGSVDRIIFEDDELQIYGNCGEVEGTENKHDTESAYLVEQERQRVPILEALQDDNPKKLGEILDHIEDFLKSRKNDGASLKKITIQAMYHDFREKYPGKISIGYYQNILAQTDYKLELGFLDRCCICKSIGEQFGSAENRNIRDFVNRRLSNHLGDCQSALEDKRNEEVLARKNETSVVSTFGFQPSFPIPFLNGSESIFNFTIQQESNNPYLEKPKCIVWSQVKGKRSANEIASCLFEYLKTLPKNVKTVIFYSSSCSGEIRGKALVMMFSYFMVNQNSLKSIEHRFLDSGHFREKKYLNHDWIGNIMRDYGNKVSSLHNWYNSFKEAAKLNKTSDFVFMTPKMFYDFDRLWKNEVEKPYLDEDIRWLQYTNQGTVYCKTSLRKDYSFKLFFLRSSAPFGKLLKNVKLCNISSDTETEEGKKDHLNSLPIESVIIKEELNLPIDYLKREEEKVGEPPSKMPRQSI